MFDLRQPHCTQLVWSHRCDPEYCYPLRVSCFFEPMQVEQSRWNTPTKIQSHIWINCRNIEDTLSDKCDTSRRGNLEDSRQRASSSAGGGTDAEATQKQTKRKRERYFCKFISSKRFLPSDAQNFPANRNLIVFLPAC